MYPTSKFAVLPLLLTWKAIHVFGFVGYGNTKVGCGVLYQKIFEQKREKKTQVTLPPGELKGKDLLMEYEQK